MTPNIVSIAAILLAALAAVHAEDRISVNLVPADWDAALAGDQVMRRLVRVSAPQVKGAHDAEFVCVGERAYIVEHDNDVQPGHGAGPQMYCVLSIVNLKTLKIEKTIPLAKSEQVFENVTLPAGACFVPRILQLNGQAVRCYFEAGDLHSRERQTWYRDFDLRSETFECGIHKAQIKTSAGVFDMQPRHFHADAALQGFKKPAKTYGLYLFDSFKQFDGKTYVAINNWPGKQNALALVHEDRVTFEVIGHFNEPQSQQLSEASVNRLPDGTWMAICRNDSGNYHFTGSADGVTWSVGKEMPFVPNGLNSKPTFDRFGEVYYLGWQEATRIGGCHRSVFNVDISRDGRTWERKYRFETPESFQYPTFHEHDGVIWLSVSQSDHGGSTDRIMFGKLEEVGRFESQAGKRRIEWPTPPAEPALMQRGVKLFTDRSYTLQEMPDAVKGLTFLRTSIEQTDVKVTRPGTLYALTATERPRAASQEKALRAAGFEKVDVPEVQFFPGEINRVSLYQKAVESGERLRFRKLVFLVMDGGTEIEVYRPVPPKPWSENEGELLDNGIRLPKTWPPDSMIRDSREPMPVPYLEYPPEIIPIDVGRQLFVDDFLIEATELRREFHQPVKYEGNPVLRPETELEMNQGYCPNAAPFSDGVFFDPKDGLFKMWYQAGWFDGVALATSRDGLHWERPELAVLPGTNRVLAPRDDLRRDGVSVWLDHDAEDPAERYKMYFFGRQGKVGEPLRGGTSFLLTSPDGIDWEWRGEIGPTSDNNTFFYNPFRKVWVFSVRHGSRFGGRARSYWESRDFLAPLGGWGQAAPVFWLGADRLDKPHPAIGNAPQLYKLDAVAYESLMLGLLQPHYGPDNSECAKGGFPKLTELQVAFSRDGFHWDRSARDTFIGATMEPDSWERAYIHSVGGVCLVVGDKLHFYYGAFQGDESNRNSNGHWNGMYANASTGLAMLRRDGFASMEGSGQLTTRPVRFSGKHFFMNHNGEVRVEVLDGTGQVLASSRTTAGDDTKRRVEWEGREDLAEFAGQPMRFRFHQKKGSLYAFWVTPDPEGASGGYLGAGGPGYAGMRDLPKTQ